MTMKKVWRVISFVLVVCVLFSGYYLYSMFDFVDTVKSNRTFSTGENPLETAKWEGKEQVNILLLGVDRRNPNERPRSDTMLLVTINPNTKKMAMFSIMRDTFVSIPGVGMSKINAAFAEGGPELLIKTVQKFLDIPIHYYVATDFEGFAKIVDAIGGVEVDVKERMVHADDGVYDILLEKGRQRLDGKKALMYVRYRDNLRADFSRTERQRELLKLVAGELQSPGKLLKLPSILKEVTPYTQSNIGSGDLYKLVALGLSLDSQGMKTDQIPPVEELQETTLVDGEQVLLPDVQGTRDYVQKMIAGTADRETGTQAGTAVAGNGGGSVGSHAGAGGSGAGTKAGAGSTSGAGSASGHGTAAQNGSSQGVSVGDGQGKRGKVTGEFVNIRQKPGTEHPVIGQVYMGDTVAIEGQIGDWYYVQTRDGMYGYIKSSLLMLQ
jgi:LCP family protein required for cell wall assembly